MCVVQADCDDGQFCNGSERCAPDVADANATGCVSGSAPCGAGTCDESADECGDCDTDADDDGHINIACGGDDCDDDDPGRFPRNPEVGDAANVDEDCNLATVAGVVDGDTDVDGFISVLCCNELPDGQLRCGPDCDDGRANVRPGVAEVCDAERLDENCSGQSNEGCVCAESDSRDCSEAGALGACGLVRQACVGGVWPSDCPSTTGDEVCEGSVDEDCDGNVDEGFECCMGDTQDCADFCGTDAVETCTAANMWGVCRAPEVCNYCDDDADGSLADDRALATANTTRDLLTSGTAYGAANAPQLFGFGSPLSGAFALDASTRVRLGYGTTTLNAAVTPECTTGSLTGGWSSWVLRANDGDNANVSPLTSAGTHGEPTAREGYVMSRYWASTLAFSNVRIGGGTTMFGFAGDGYGGGASCTAGGGTYPTDRQRIVVTVDDPSTQADEFAVCAYSVDSSGVADELGCCNGLGTSAGECPTRLAVGDFVVAGVSASKSAGTHRLAPTATYTQANTCAQQRPILGGRCCAPKADTAALTWVMLRRRPLARAAQRGGFGHGDPTCLGGELEGVKPGAGLEPEEGREFEVVGRHPVFGPAWATVPWHCRELLAAAPRGDHFGALPRPDVGLGRPEEGL